jgi:release factor glutamine methyltransferase
MLIFFGTSGDLGYLQQLMAQHRFHATIVAHQTLVKDDMRVGYFTYRLSG